MNDLKFVADLKVGDMVVDSNGAIRPVVKLTATQVVLKAGMGEVRFDKSTGRQRGTEQWKSNWLKRKATDKDVESGRRSAIRRSAANFITTAKLYEVDLDKLCEAAKLLGWEMPK